jgi:outer membrane protein OmpA-like peptidoglycan-associated protein
MSEVLGLGSTLDMGLGLTGATSGTTDTMTSSPSGTNLSKLLPWLVLLLAALGLFYFIQKGCNSSGEPAGEPTTTSVDTMTKTNTPAADLIGDPGAKKMPYTLPSGKKLELAPTSFTARIFDFIRGAGSGGDVSARTPNCFRFDEVHFVPGTSQLTPQSDDQLNELYEVLKNFPVVIISIEGHTDNVGDPEKNKVYSEQKAQAIKTWLEKKGIEADRLIASGWGDRNPFADNASEEGKAMNRRVEVCVVKK